MKVFKLDNERRIVQIVGKKRIKEWTEDLPLIFVKNIRDNHLSNYADQKENVIRYLDEVVEIFGLPKLVKFFEEGDSFKLIEMIKIASYIENNISSYSGSKSILNKLSQIIKDSLETKLKSRMIEFLENFQKLSESPMTKKEINELNGKKRSFLEDLEDFSIENLDLISYILEPINKLSKTKDKDIAELAKKVLKNLKNNP
jgi:hypothetical protein